jgi:hypothetical protein
MNAAVIDLHSLTTIWAPDLSDECQTFLQRKFPLFLRPGAEAPTEPDIVVSHLKSPATASIAELYTQALYGFCIFDYAGEVAVGVMHRGIPDVLVVPSDPIKVLCRPRSRVTTRLYGLLLFAIQLCLRRKNAFLAHGSVVARDGRGLLISGHQGTRKTQILLTFLHHGWDCLSDDKFILHQGRFYLFESHVYVNDHHFPKFPWLEPAVRRPLWQRVTGPLRSGLRSFTHHYLPGRMPSGLLRRLDPACQCEVAELAPGRAACMEAKPSHAFVLLNHRGLQAEKISHQVAVSHLTNINRLLFRDLASMEQMLRLYADIDCDPFALVLARNFPDIPCHRVTQSGRTSLKQVYEAILTCCEAP